MTAAPINSTIAAMPSSMTLAGFIFGCLFLAAAMMSGPIAVGKVSISPPLEAARPVAAFLGILLVVGSLFVANEQSRIDAEDREATRVQAARAPAPSGPLTPGSLFVETHEVEVSSVKVGQVGTRSISVENHGQQLLDVSAAVTEGAKVFSADWTAKSFGPFGQARLIVRFAPDRVGRTCGRFVLRTDNREPAQHGEILACGTGQ